MKTTKYIFFLALSALVTGCGYSRDERSPEKESASYNICLIIDGTDRLDKQQSIPEVGIDFVMELAEKIQSSGEGTLWLSWVDDNSENNSNAYLKILSAPVRMVSDKKMDYETRIEYTKRVNMANEKFISDSIEFEKGKTARFSKFRDDVQSLLRLAYSEQVARNRKGSDINGAINLGIRLLNSIPKFDVCENHLILVSDLVDNVGKSIVPDTDNISITSVNRSFSKHNLGGLVTKELGSLDQIFEYIFQ